MKAKALNLDNVSNPLDKHAWKALQLAQFKHDETYHREISRLSVQDRLKHMTLHFAKYAGSLATDVSECQYKRILTDAFIIAVSSANILNLDIGQKLTLDRLISQSNIDFQRGLSIAAGRMAAACEKLDHLEAVPFREDLIEGILDILALTINEFVNRELQAEKLVSDRLTPVKQKSMFYGHI